MGRDIKTILTGSDEMLVEFSGIIENEIIKEEESLLINQVLETHPSKSYGEVYEAFKGIVYELRK